MLFFVAFDKNNREVEIRNLYFILFC